MKNIILIVAAIVATNTHAQSLATTSRGNKFNPSMSLNALTLFKNSSRDSESDGFSLQEVELQFSADVDAYFRAQATIGIHQEMGEHDHEEGEEEEHEGGFHVEPEEVFVETISLPSVTLKAGKFYSNFGKLNSIHTHARPFIYKSEVQEAVFGHEGLAETGVGVAYLTPLPWFSELDLQTFSPKNEDLFTESHHSMGYSFKWKNLWDLSEHLTFELGTSALRFSDHNHESDIENKTGVYGTDLTFKWRPSKNAKSRSFMWLTEFLFKERSGDVKDYQSGVTTFMKYQFATRWYAQAKYEFLGFKKLEDVRDLNSYAALLAFVPTEFSSIRAQYDTIHDGMDSPERRISLQLNISIGAHPAHQY